MTELYKDFLIPPLSEKDNIIEIILVTSGYVIVEGNFNPIRINLQEIHLAVSQNSGYIVESSDELRGWYCRFNSAFVNKNSWREDFMNEIEVISSFLYKYPLRLTIRVFDRLSFHFHSLHQLLKESSPDILLINAYLLVCIHEIRKLMKESILDFYPVKAFSIVKQYNDLLLKNIGKEQKIDFYSNQLNISPNHLNKSVKTVLGLTAISLLNEKRLMNAQSLLQFTDLTINEIALQLGFYDQSYFSRFFKKRTKQSPLEFRKAFLS